MTALAWIRSAVGLLILIAVVDYVVLPRIAGSEQSLRLLRHVDPWWAGLAIALEAMSLVSYSLSTRSLLRRRPPGFGWLLRSDLTGYGLGHIVPGGGATTMALRCRLLVSGGAAPAGAAATLRFALHRVARRWRRRIREIAMQLRDLLARRHVRRSFLTWATFNWLLDAAALWFFLVAFGHPMNPAALLLAYSIAVLTVVSWRLFQFWIPVPVAGLCYLSLRTPGWRTRVAAASRH